MYNGDQWAIWSMIWSVNNLLSDSKLATPAKYGAFHFKPNEHDSILTIFSNKRPGLKDVYGILRVNTIFWKMNTVFGFFGSVIC